MGGEMRGRISTYIIIPIVSIMVIICFGAFYTGATVASNMNPNPPYANASQTYIGTNFFSSVNGFVANINNLQIALQGIQTSALSGNVGGLAVSTITSAVDIILVFLGLPVLVVSFIYDIVSLVTMGMLPTVAPPEFLIVIGMATLIPMMYILMELASSIRPPGLAKW
jgi:hypothetical protein